MDIGTSSGTSIIRISQRPSKSCTECIRRKNRCNKQIPCDVCLKRNVGHLCKLESLYQPGNGNPPIPPDAAPFIADLYKQLESVKKRLCRLENSSTSHVNKRRRLDTDFREDTEEAVGATTVEEEEPQDAATTLEFLALGIDRRVGPEEIERPSRASSPRRSDRPLQSSPHILSEPAERPFPDSIVDALLPEVHVRSILRFAEEYGLWQHCCVLFSRVWTELDQFWSAISEDDTWSRVEPTWVALLYTLLGIAVHQMSEIDAKNCGLADADRLVLPNAFISAAEDALYHGQFLSRPTLWTVQAVAMLSLCGHNVCESDLLSSLLAVGVKTAQTLKLHTLGGRSERCERKEGNLDVRQVEDLELGKRLWWSLAQEDWFGIPFRGVWAIHHDHFDTPMPFNCHDADLACGRYINRSSDELTVSLKQRFSSSVAVIVRNVFHRLRHLGSQSPFDIASKAEQDIQALLAQLPAPLRQHGDLSSPSIPPWANTMRHYLFISASHKIIVVHRAALNRGGDKRQRSSAELACVAAAEAIVEELDRGGNQAIAMQSLWTIPYHGLAAAVVLAMSIPTTEDPATIETRRHGVDKARRALERLSPTSRIARRGLQVIADLLQEIETLLKDRQTNGSQALSRVVGRIKLPVNEMRQTIAVPSPNLPSVPQPEHLSTSPLFDFGTIDDPSQLLWSLQQSVPDVGRLFDGSLGDFDWTG